MRPISARSTSTGPVEQDEWPDGPAVGIATSGTGPKVPVRTHSRDRGAGPPGHVGRAVESVGTAADLVNHVLPIVSYRQCGPSPRPLSNFPAFRFCSTRSRGELGVGVTCTRTRSAASQVDPSITCYASRCAGGLERGQRRRVEEAGRPRGGPGPRGKAKWKVAGRVKDELVSERAQVEGCICT